jgi:hypothetical protein
VQSQRAWTRYMRLHISSPTIKRKTRVFNYGFNYILKLKISLPIIKCFFNSKWCFQQPTKIVENVELNPQHNRNLLTRINFSINIEVTRF